VNGRRHEPAQRHSAIAATGGGAWRSDSGRAGSLGVASRPAAAAGFHPGSTRSRISLFSRPDPRRARPRPMGVPDRRPCGGTGQLVVDGVHRPCAWSRHRRRATSMRAGCHTCACPAPDPSGQRYDVEPACRRYRRPCPQRCPPDVHREWNWWTAGWLDRRSSWTSELTRPAAAPYRSSCPKGPPGTADPRSHQGTSFLASVASGASMPALGWVPLGGT